MAWSSQVQFTAGEISPRLYGRTDLAQYYQGCRTLKNWLVLPHGGVTKRAGTRFVAPVKDHAHSPRLMSFVFGADDAYVLEVGNDGAGYMRVFREQAQALETAQNVVSATQANPVVLEVTGHGWSNDDWIYVDGITGMSELNGRWFQVAGAATDTVQLSGVDGTGYAAYVSGGTAARVYTLASLPWAEADLLQVMYAQSTDTLFLAHAGYAPKTLTRSGHTAWTLGTYTVTAGKDPAPAFTSAGDYPGAVTFIQQRLAWAASTNNPQKIWLSKIGDFLDLLAGTNDGDGFDATVASPRVNTGRWLLGSKGLFFGTAGAVWRVNTDVITPSNFPLKRVASGGCTQLAPLDIDDNVVYVGRYGASANAGRRLNALSFNVASDDYAPDDISIISEHITGTGVRDFAWQEQPDRTLWLVCGCGTLASCTYYPRQQIVAFARHILGGSGDGPGGAPRVESVAVVPGANGDEVWLVVKRTIGGATRRYIEVIDPTPSPDNLYVDAAIVGSGSASAVWGGLWHLEGETVQIRADGGPVGDKVVADGAVTLDTAAEAVEIGLGYTAELETNNLEIPLKDGTAASRKRTISRLGLELKDTLGISAKAKGDGAGDAIEFRNVTDAMDRALSLYSGPVPMKPPGGWDRLGRVVITSDSPLPATILALTLRAEVND